MTDPTDVEIQAGADAIARSWRVLSPTSRRHLAKLMLRAVLPDHDARVRADERARVAGEILAACRCDPGPHDGPNLPCQRDVAAADLCVFCEIVAEREPAE